MFDPVFYIKWVISLIGFVLLGFIVSLGVEYGGFYMGWWDQTHASQMIINEIRFIDHETNKLPGIPTPIEAVESFLKMLVGHGMSSVQMAEKLAERQASADLISIVSMSVSVATLYAIKLIICMYSMTLFAVFVLMAINEGFMSRHLRKMGGGAESSWKYHKFKRSIRPTFISGWVIYLMTPVSIHPNYILATMSMIFALLLFGTISNWKKLT
jgi:integrating conjugative element membrane protein (TIGR03747 family)